MSEPSDAGPGTDLSSLSGIEVLRLAMDDDAPPRPTIGRLLGMHLTHLEHGRVVFALVTQPQFSNPLGSVHGGIAATMLDSAMGCAVHSTLGPRDWYTTLELKVNYIRAASTSGDELTATGTTIHVGRTTATADGRVHDQLGRLVAHGTTTCLIRRA